MTLAFDLGIDDLLAFQKRFAETNRMMRRARQGAVIGSVALLALLAFVFSEVVPAGLRTFTFIYFGAFSVLVAIFLPGSIKRSFLRRCRKLYLRPENANFLGPRTMTFDEDGIGVEAAGMSGQVEWPALLSWVEEGNYCYLYVTEQTAYVIPLGKIGPQQAGELRAMLATCMPQQSNK